MMKYFPKCPFCQSEANYTVSPSNTVVQCNSCKAKFSSDEFKQLKGDLTKLILISLPLSLPDAKVLEHLKSITFKSLPILYWQNMNAQNTVENTPSHPSEGPKIRDILTKHADWQPIPKQVTSELPICPICRKRTTWEIRDKYGLTERGYTITCSLCKAEWEYTISKLSAKDMLLGPGAIAIYRATKIAKADSTWILRKIGNHPAKPNMNALLDKGLPVSTWKQMTGSFCGKCGNPLSEDEKFCPKCGNPRG